MTLTLRTLAALLGYPSAELQAAVPELRSALAGDTVFPGMVTHYKSDAVVVDPSTINFGTDNVYGSDSYGGGAGGAVDPGAAFK